MKRNLIGGAVLAVLFSVPAGAQTCSSPYPDWHPDGTTTTDLTGSTCGHETGIVGACQASFGAPGAAYVAKISPTATGSYTSIAVAGEAAAYSATLYAVNTVNATTTPCDSQTGNPTAGGDTGVCATSSSVAINRTNLPDGQSFFLIVTGADFDAPGACGNFTLHANGTLPVTLQNFSVS